MATNLLSSTVSSAQQATAVQYNNLRKDILQNAGDYATSTGSSNAYLLAVDAQVSALAAGDKFRFLANFANTGACTLNVNSLGAKTIKKNYINDLQANDIHSGQYVEVEYDGTNMQMISQIGNIIPGFREPFTASGAIKKNDSVYISASQTVKSFLPTGMSNGVSVTTSATATGSASVALPLSTNGNYLHVSGGVDSGHPVGLNIQVRSINSDETDFVNYGSISINTSQTVCGFDVKSIGVDKFLFIWQQNNGGTSTGIYACAVSVSGTTCSKGAQVTLDATGNMNWIPSCAKLNTDKALVFYQRSSDSFFMTQVLTVSTLTISTNTAVVVHSSNGSASQTRADQLGTDLACIVYSDDFRHNAYGSTINVSGTVPTVNAENLLVTDSANMFIRSTIKAISATKLLFAFADYPGAGGWQDSLAFINVSGSSLALSSIITLSNTQYTTYYGMCFIGQNLKYMMMCYRYSSSSTSLNIIDITGSAPTIFANQSLLEADDALYGSPFVVKVRPWVYYVQGDQSGNSDYIVKLIIPSFTRIGIAENDIADTATGNIIYRYQTESNHTGLTPALLYYIDDDSQPTPNISNVTQYFGISLNSTEMLIQ